MAKVEVKVNGETFPCRPTMGAMLRFKKETGKEVTELTANNLSDLCVYLYCCVASACAADKVAFDYTLLDFADALDQAQVNDWAKQMQETSDDGGEKKS